MPSGTTTSVKAGGDAGAGSEPGDTTRSGSPAESERTRPFVLALAMFALCFGGLGICMFPFIVPVEITLWEATAPRASQIFMLVGASVLIPVILAYTAYAYWVFRGKIDPEAGYH